MGFIQDFAKQALREAISSGVDLSDFKCCDRPDCEVMAVIREIYAEPKESEMPPFVKALKDTFKNLGFDVQVSNLSDLLDETCDDPDCGCNSVAEDPVKKGWVGRVYKRFPLAGGGEKWDLHRETFYSDEDGAMRFLQANKQPHRLKHTLHEIRYTQTEVDLVQPAPFLTVVDG